jgi:deoxyribodipyrimidine photo-lyase
MKPVVNVFIFRRDLRVVDNLALDMLVRHAPDVPILPLFIFNPVQISPEKNNYYSKNAVQFMVESLKDLRMACDETLNCLHGYDISILDQLIKSFIIQAVGFNKDYTPFAKSRDEQLLLWCEKKKITVFTAEDYTLFPMGSITTELQKPYEVYTPFYKKCLSKVNTIPQPPAAPKKPLFYKAKIPSAVKNIDTYYGSQVNQALAVRGGRSQALEILKRAARREFANYESVRDFPAQDKTTKLSAYLKFGCISVREAFATMKKAYGVNHGLVRELIWKEFYAHITFHFPKILDGQVGGINKPFKDRYVNTKWSFNNDHWHSWCQGKTGYPMVDAGMRQLNATGWMHNRCRMITSMFLTKDLRMDWRKGEQYFATMLVDVDPSSNNGGWQWCSSTGTDSQPYFRVLSPIIQAQRFDPDAKFIKQWVPELKTVPPKDILNWETAYHKYPDVNYPAPIVIHREQVAKLITFFKEQQ